jgi:DNA-binding response OmpR family regulator
MTLSSMLVSRDWQEVSVLECILGGLHIGVDVESEPDRARVKLEKSKIDALIVDCDLSGATSFLRNLQSYQPDSVPLVIVSGSSGRKQLSKAGAAYVFEKPISVEQAVHTLSAARNQIMHGRLRYHRQHLDMPVTLLCGAKERIPCELLNLSQGGVGIQMDRPLKPTKKKLQITFTLPKNGRKLKLQGEVAWADPHGRAGIHFIEAQGKARKDLQLFLEQQFFVRGE